MSLRPHASRARAIRRLVLLAALTLALTGCGSSTSTKPATYPSATATQPLALAPAHRSGSDGKTIRRYASGQRRAATQRASVASPPCPEGEKRTATALCYSPAAQTKLVKKLGPCPAGQVVADNGACQPLTSKGPTNQPSLPARCRIANRAGCIPHGSLQGSRPVTPGPGFDAVFH